MKYLDLIVFFRGAFVNNRMEKNVEAISEIQSKNGSMWQNRNP